MKLQNIHNNERDIYLFCREDDGKQVIIKDSDFFPYWFELNPRGEYLSYDNQKVMKLFANTPSDVRKASSGNSYSSDIPFSKRYLIDKVDNVEPSLIKYMFIDIETMSKDLPDAEQSKDKISCITIYNSLSDEYRTWWLPDYNNEKDMLDSFVEYVRNESPDIFLSWNIKFDYNYLYNRIPNFAKRISPVGLERYCGEKVKYPVGISILEYGGNKVVKGFFSKIHMKESTYRLDDIAQKYLGKGKEYKNKDVDFSILTDSIRKRNIEDVKILVDLEKKFQIIKYYDEVRRISKTPWEDLVYNSRVVEMLLFEEAKLKNIVLPNKQKREKTSDIQGATREALKLGVFSDISISDLTSAYPSVIIDYCLDTQNIVEEESEDTVEINGVLFKQNKDALLPSVVKKILELKINLGKEKELNPDDDITATKYNAIKGIVNSTYGVIASEYFRLYDQVVGSTITFLVRDLLLFTKERLIEEDYEVIYWDTDGIMIDSKENVTSLLNILVKEWANSYGKENIELTFEYKGFYEKLFLLGKCHYVGYLNKNGHIEKEIKGVEIKRNSSSGFEAEFQEKLIDKILDKISQEEIERWIKREKLKMRTLDLEYIGFPTKINNKKYKNTPIFVRALDNTKRINKTFDVTIGEKFYYIFVLPRGDINVLAFTEEDKNIIEDFKIDWKEVERRSIDSKVDKINDCLGWNISHTNHGRLF